ncbi:heat shock protein transcriptional repressor HspR [Kitasatospora sp. NPDC057940]|uniref:heat shock protein transcriptional repressor HspR n=1 Tax=unclassified Kitasatospora TaxID=2633591 RepID=UPI00352F4041|nr:helix-turn-helix domain-containing protein [Kitasatospora sp. NBC_01300]
MIPDSPIGPGIGEGLPGIGSGLPGDGRRTRRPAAPPQYVLTEDTPVYVISVAAELSGLHPQTLRQYDRLGLVSPDRTAGRGRRYSARDIQQLREVQRLSQDEGINLAGIKRIIELENQVTALQSRIGELVDSLEGATSALQQREAAVHASYRRDLVPYQPPTQSSALVVWRPKR